MLLFIRNIQKYVGGCNYTLHDVDNHVTLPPNYQGCHLRALKSHRSDITIPSPLIKPGSSMNFPTHFNPAKLSCVDNRSSLWQHIGSCWSQTMTCKLSTHGTSSIALQNQQDKIFINPRYKREKKEAQSCTICVLVKLSKLSPCLHMTGQTASMWDSQ